MTPDVLSTVSEQEAIFEVVTSEKQYMGSLNLVQEVCFVWQFSQL